MAKPRVFISSTFYDLKQIRADLDNFILGLGYDVVRNEEGGIPYGTNFKLEDYCYKEVSMVDIVVAIIGGDLVQPLMSIKNTPSLMKK